MKSYGFWELSEDGKLVASGDFSVLLTLARKLARKGASRILLEKKDRAVVKPVVAVPVVEVAGGVTE